MTNNQKSGGELLPCPMCGSEPYPVPQTCGYSGPGVVHRYRILCPNCKTQTGECVSPEAANNSWQSGHAYVPVEAARTPSPVKVSGEEGERARIVEWLRGADESLPDLDRDSPSAARQAVYCIELADAIERGDHLSTIEEPRG